MFWLDTESSYPTASRSGPLRSTPECAAGQPAPGAIVSRNTSYVTSRPTLGHERWTPTGAVAFDDAGPESTGFPVASAVEGASSAAASTATEASKRRIRPMLRPSPGPAGP